LTREPWGRFTIRANVQPNVEDEDEDEVEVEDGRGCAALDEDEDEVEVEVEDGRGCAALDEDEDEVEGYRRWLADIPRS
jgi:hypothetical protein